MEYLNFARKSARRTVGRELDRVDGALVLVELGQEDHAGLAVLVLNAPGLQGVFA